MVKNNKYDNSHIKSTEILWGWTKTHIEHGKKRKKKNKKKKLKHTWEWFNAMMPVWI